MGKIVVLALCGFIALTVTERAVRAGAKRLRLSQEDLEHGVKRQRTTLKVLLFVVGACGVVFSVSLPLFPLLAGDQEPWHPLRKTLDLVQGTVLAVFVIGGIVIGHKIRAFDAAIAKAAHDDL